MMRSVLGLLLALVGALALTACGDLPGDGTATVKTYDKLVLTAIPDDKDTGRMREHFGALAAHLSTKLGIPVEYEHVENYEATVTALANDQAQLAWFGAITTGQAMNVMGDRLVTVACRDIDKGFVSIYIAHKDVALPDEIRDLAHLAELAQGRGWNLTYGSQSSTSSHAMPRHFFAQQAGKQPEAVFTNVAFSGGHDVVLAKVANREFHFGALSQPHFFNGPQEQRDNVRIAYTTPEFVNYCLCTHTGLGDELIGRIRQAMLELQETEEGRQLLAYLGAQQFVPADRADWNPYAEITRSEITLGG